MHSPEVSYPEKSDKAGCSSPWANREEMQLGPDVQKDISSPGGSRGAECQGFSSEAGCETREVKVDAVTGATHQLPPAVVSGCRCFLTSGCFPHQAVHFRLFLWFEFLRCRLLQKFTDAISNKVSVISGDLVTCKEEGHHHRHHSHWELPIWG